MLQVSSAEVDRIDSFGARVTNATSMIHSPHVLLIDFGDSFMASVTNIHF